MSGEEFLETFMGKAVAQRRSSFAASRLNWQNSKSR